MTEELKQIGKRIKGIREISGLQPEVIAQELGLSIEQYFELENGHHDIPISMLYKLTQKFGIELSALLVGDEPHLHVYCVVRNGKGVSVERNNQYQYESLASNFIHKKAEPFVVTVSPESNMPEFNNHPGQEFNYVLEGCLKVLIDNHEVILNQGDSIFFDSNFKHAMVAMNGAPAKFLAFVV